MAFLGAFTKMEWTLGLILVFVISLHLRGPPELPKYTAAELMALQTDQEDGTPAVKSLSVFGYIFNVTSAPEFYEEDEPYEQFVGHDCTRAFALSSLDTDDLDKDLEGLHAMERDRVETSYRETYIRKYPIIGELTELPYDISERPSRDSKNALGSMTEEHNAGIEGKCPFTKKVNQARDYIYSLLPALLNP